MDPVHRYRELSEWWQLRRRKPAALARQAQREAIAARADYENAAWNAGMTGAEYGRYQPGRAAPPPTPTELTKLGPAPLGPRPQEIAIGGSIILAAFVLLALIGATIGPPPMNASATDVAATRSIVSETTSRTAVAKTTPESKAPAADLPAVPIGKSQTLTGSNPDGGHYSARATVMSLTRTSADTVVIAAKFENVEGVLPLGSGAWTLETAGGRSIPVNGYDDAGFGADVRKNAEGTLEVDASDDTKLTEVRLQPPSKKYAVNSTNETAVWTVDNVTTSLTTTPEQPQSDNTTGNRNYNAPNVNGPNVKKPKKPRVCRHTKWC